MRENESNRIDAQSVSDEEFWLSALQLFGGIQAHSLEVAIYYPSRRIEVVGTLPESLRHGLQQAAAWSEPLRRRSKRMPVGSIVWRVGHRPSDVTYNIPSVAALVDLVASRAKLLDGRDAHVAGAAA